MSLRFDAQRNPASAQTALTGQTASYVFAGNSVNVGDGQRQKVKALSARVTGTAATATITYTGSWQGSNDGTTWETFANGPQNAASVVLATGTSAAFVKLVPAPDQVYGYRFVRYVVTTGVATGASGDLLSIGYCYRSA